jgi:hypothetical protein
MSVIFLRRFHYDYQFHYYTQMMIYVVNLVKKLSVIEFGKNGHL